MAVESLRCKIPSTLDDLNALHEKFKWIPNSSQIRPNEKVLEHKREILHSISAYWTNFTDYILHTVFEKPRVAGIDGKWEVYDKDIEGHTRFKENQFPYSLDEGHHWVMWYGYPMQPCSDEQITENIHEALNEMLGGFEVFDFAWYINPKMTVPEVFHVQVFWVRCDVT